MYDFEDLPVGDDYVIRKARRNDCVKIVQMIKDLAELLGVGQYPKPDAKSLEVNGFDITPPAYGCLVVEYKNNKRKLNNGFDNHEQKPTSLVGYAFFFFTFGSWYGKELFLEDIYVESEHQRKGIGTKLFDSLVEIAVNSNCENLEFLAIDGNPINAFYKRRGAIDESVKEKYHYYSIKNKQLIKLKEENRRNKSDSEAKN